MHGTEVSYYKKLFQTVGNIMRMMEKDDLTKYLLFLEDVFPYMEKYRYRKGTKEIILEMKQLLKGNENGSATDRALLLDYQACMETNPEKAIKLEKEALAQIKEITEDNAHLVSNLHANLGGLYRMNGQAELAKEHMEKGIFLLEQYQLLYTNDSIPQQLCCLIDRIAGTGTGNGCSPETCPDHQRIQLRYLSELCPGTGIHGKYLPAHSKYLTG